MFRVNQVDGYRRQSQGWWPSFLDAAGPLLGRVVAGLERDSHASRVTDIGRPPEAASRRGTGAPRRVISTSLILVKSHEPI